MAAER